MSVNSKMTALANQVRDLSGTTNKKGIVAMATDVQSANSEIAEQLDLINQITSALIGKASGGGDSEPCLLSLELDGPCEYFQGIFIAVLADGTVLNTNHITDTQLLLKNSLIITTGTLTGEITLVQDASGGFMSPVYQITGDAAILANQ